MTVGLFIDSLTGTTGYQEAVWRGVSDAARKEKIRLITYVGGGLEYSLLNAFAKTQNIAYDLYSPDIADGLILCGGTLGNGIDKGKFSAFCERFISKPVTSVGPAESRIPRVLVDNDRGMKDVILHLIKVHGYRKIACITGPKGNIDADRRLNMYLTTLEENGIAVDKKLIYEGDFNEKSGHDAVYRWIREMGVTPEAIVASNDTMAFGAMDALQELGLMVPYSVAVTGFDDLESAATATPPLTTVSQPMVLQGARALDILCRKIRGESVNLEILEDPALVCRQSCGCLSAAVTAYGDHEPLETADAIERMGTILAPPGKEIDAALRDSVTAIVRAYTSPEGDGKDFLAALSKLLFADIRLDADVSRWNGAIDVLRHTGTPRYTLLHQAQAMIGETDKQILFRKQAIAARDEAELMAAERELITSFNLDNLRDVMATHFVRLGINGAALCLFDDPEKPLESARLVAAVRDGKKLECPRQSFSPYILVPPSVRFTAQNESPLIVEPIYYREHRLGYIVFEQTNAPGVVYESLAAEISAAIEGTMLIERITATEKQLVERTNAIEGLIRPMIESIGSISRVSSEHRREIEKLDSLNRRNENALKGMITRTGSLSAVLEKTGTLVAAINDISELINVVAINASIEAAHVGKAGAGFAVIAGEVRKLAASTNKNAEAIGAFLDGINADISGISVSNGELSESFSLLANNVQGTVSLLEEISSRMETLDKDSTEILSIMNR